MKRQHIRKLFLTVSLLLFPITLYYFSPIIILYAGLNGIINGSFILFISLFLLSIPFGRIFCSYICPGGGLQECAFAINDKNPKQGWKNNIKYIIWVVWIIAVIFCYLQKGEIISVNFFFATDHGISVTHIIEYTVYYGIVLLIFVPTIFFGKRVFCHYFCWMAPFMVIGIKLRQLLHVPGIHISAHRDNCISCGKCDKNCPMGLDVSKMAQDGQVNSTECIQCGACIDLCPQKVLYYKMKTGN